MNTIARVGIVVWDSVELIGRQVESGTAATPSVITN
jgi:hypothetical protein